MITSCKLFTQEHYEYTKGIIRRDKSKNDRQCNDKKESDKRINNDLHLQNITENPKLKIGE